MLAEAGTFLAAQEKESPAKELEAMTSHATLFQCINQSYVPAAEKARARIAQEAVVVVSAGAETTSRVLSLMMFHLLDNPQVLRRLRGEIDEAMPDVNRVPSVKETSALPYLVTIPQTKVGIVR